MSAGTGLDVRLLGPDDAALLDRVVDGVFDAPVRPALRDAFLADPRHHLAVALDGDAVVGFASAVHYVNPDKDPELWINEVGVAPSHHRRGLGRRLVDALLARGRALGCAQAWVLTDHDNLAARRLYEAAGGVDAGQHVLMYEFPLGEEEAAG
jgi:ribosomal protein S18 acetylase RimI-like enzyme